MIPNKTSVATHCSSWVHRFAVKRWTRNILNEQMESSPCSAMCFAFIGLLMEWHFGNCHTLNSNNYIFLITGQTHWWPVLYGALLASHVEALIIFWQVCTLTAFFAYSELTNASNKFGGNTGKSHPTARHWKLISFSRAVPKASAAIPQFLVAHNSLRWTASW